MTHKSNRCNLPMQKAGQAVGAALLQQPLPSNTGQTLTGGSVRVAGGETMSEKTSTAALDSLRRGPLQNQRRAPRHPAGASSSGMHRAMQRITRMLHYMSQAASKSCRTAGFGPGTASAVPVRSCKDRALVPWACGHVSPKLNVCYKEDTMNPATQHFPRRNFKAILAVIFRISLSLFLWTLGAAAMDIRVTPIQPTEHRIVFNFSVDRASAESLQRWVNAGHDSWCRDPQLVATAALRRISPGLAETESASLSLELQHSAKTKAVYTFHSLDGRTTYCITLRRHLYLLSSAGSIHHVVWIPESAEIITRDTQD
jgi:hypothetical protein